MMDISMYGNHSTHSSGFQSDLSASGYPHYFSAGHHHHIQNHQNVSTYAAASAAVGSPTTISVQTASNGNNSNHFYAASAAAVAHPHLYSPTAIEYGIHTTSSNNSPSEQYYEHAGAGNEGYFGAVNNNNSGSPENHIISTDNGLSYTNLDYIAYQQAAAQANSSVGAQGGYIDEKIHLSHHYNEEMLMNSSQNPLHHHHHHHHATNNPWHHPNTSNSYNVGGGVGESGNLVANQMQAISGNNLQSQQQQIQQQHMHSPNSIQSTSPTLQSQQPPQQTDNACTQQQQNVPTYKWMQVKRNMPKPQCEYFFF